MEIKAFSEEISKMLLIKIILEWFEFIDDATSVDATFCILRLSTMQHFALSLERFIKTMFRHRV